MLWALLAGLIVLIAWLVASPIEIDARAPDGGDLVVLRISHPAIEMEVWLPPEVPLAWALGELALPHMNGAVCGIPVDRALVRRIISLARGERREPHEKKPRAKKKDGKPHEPRPLRRVDASRDPIAAMLPEPMQAPVHVARVLWPRHKSQIARAVRVDAFSARLVYGTGNPVTTGLAAGLLWELIASLPEPFEIVAEADWTALRISVEGEARVSVFPWRAFVAALFLGLAAWREWRALTRPVAAVREGDSSWQRTDTAAPSSRS